MEHFSAIELHETRDFGKKINVTFEFIKQNFKPLGRSILYIAGPPILVASLLLSTVMGDLMSSMFSLGSGGDPEMVERSFMSLNFWLQIILLFVFYVISIVVTTATINNYIILYGEKKSNNIEISEVWDRVRETFWMYLGTTIMIAILMIAVYLVMLIPMFVLGAISPVLIFFSVIALMVGIVYVFVTLSLVFIIRGYERAGFMESIFRSFDLIKGKWWSTFGLVIILSLIVSTISSVFFIPWYVMFIMQTLHSVETGRMEEPGTATQIIMAVLMALYYLTQMVLYALPQVGIAFQYFNLVERKEAKGLMGQIQNFGDPNPPAAPAEEQY